MKRIWLDWKSPCLAGVANRLNDLSASDGPACDLHRVMCVLPGRRAGRQLLSLLAERCSEQGQLLLPPRMVTPGDMVDVLLGLNEPSDRSLTRRFAWMAALQQTNEETRRALLPVSPASDDVMAWFDIAAALEPVHDELAGHRRSCHDVIDQIKEQMDLSSLEIERWQVLEQIQRNYLHLLVACGLDDPHQLREAALARGADRGGSHDHLVLIATPELNAIQRAVVERFAGRTTIVVHAPEALRDRFDGLGCLLEEAWKHAPIDIERDCIRLCDRPADQVHEVLRTIAHFEGRYGATDITIGMGDDQLAPALKRGAEAAGLSLHAAAGPPLRTSGPFRLLRVVADWLADPRFELFAAMLRHPDLERWLMSENESAGPDLKHRGISRWLTLLERYFSDHLDQRFAGDWLGDERQRQDLDAIYGAVTRLLQPLTGAPGPLGSWGVPVLDMLRAVYSEADATPRTSAACATLRDHLDACRALPPDLQPHVPAGAAIDILLRDAGDDPLTEDPAAEQIDMLGWLELHLDVAPALVITGVNDMAIPRCRLGDLLLPDSLRRRLGLTSNEQTYARDAYLLSAILHSRETVTLIAGRRAREGDPLTPSRLLLATEPEEVCARIEWLCGDPEEHEPPLPAGTPCPATTSAFAIPPLPADPGVLARMRVTDFRTYLACPFRFALGRLLGLESLGGIDEEVTGQRFGTLAHEVLEAFGRNEAIRDADDPDAIDAFLQADLRERSGAWYGATPPPAVRVQMARLALRLRDFANCQAALRREGWAIRHCELKFDARHELDVPGDVPMPISGKIDRIDYHEKKEQWRIIDYKTGDKVISPHKAHVGRERFKPDDELAWSDLQLPLYRFLAQQQGVTGDVELGYLVLPKAVDGVTFLPATWTPMQLDAALDLARDVVKRIRRGEFGINEDYDPTWDNFPRICQTTVFRAAAKAGGDTNGGDA